MSEISHEVCLSMLVLMTDLDAPKLQCARVCVCVCVVRGGPVTTEKCCL